MLATKVLKRIGILLVLVLFIVNFALFNYGRQLLEPVDYNLTQEDKLVEIKPNTSINGIGEMLYQKGLIRSPFSFRTYLRVKDLARRVQAGHYKLNSGMSTPEIIDKLVRGKTANYTITVSEGARVEQVADLLARKGFDSDKFLELARTKDLEFLPERDDIKYNLEGFLFPNTYQIPYGSSERDVIRIMLNEFNKQVSPLEEQIEASDYDLHEIVTIASLIEGERKVAIEEPLIASVIYNRLERGMRLQLDATVQYSLPEHKSRLLYRDLEVDSPYNTYKISALPPGPINNPSLSAINSALNPAETEYLYYVATTGGYHEFTKTYQEHLEVQQRSNN
ncbi:endolytic transglycosylase MltG [Natroniella sulfidigena]|uniref:endolytic transglycosylase MltG n=1 Tax=Natroniella sulfidigena TaxID=723921 RepID=UPI00200B5CC0|nr:endolytic transglycosylase MltG [Natroniella sulfidigena]MCK8818087.1 endolytic transglycosylase MltG [Natroniella sulfidigena]